MNRGTVTITTPSDREIAIVRTFAAPRRLVFEAYTKPELLKQWLGMQNGWRLAICEIDLRAGGAYRYVWRGPNREEMGMGGVYTEIVPGERIVATEKYDDPWYDGEATTTVTFVERDGTTTLTLLLRYESKEVRDSVLKSPMEGGLSAGFDKLDELLATSH
jgi:uncharacterized protein YndB with AHSA1/START domain